MACLEIDKKVLAFYRLLYFTPTAEFFRDLAVIFLHKKELHTNYLVRQPLQEYFILNKLNHSINCSKDFVQNSQLLF